MLRIGANTYSHIKNHTSYVIRADPLKHECACVNLHKTKLLHVNVLHRVKHVDMCNCTFGYRIRARVSSAIVATLHHLTSNTSLRCPSDGTWNPTQLSNETCAKEIVLVLTIDSMGSNTVFFFSFLLFSDIEDIEDEEDEEDEDDEEDEEEE